MARRHTADTWWWVVVALLVLWPLMMLFMMPGGGLAVGPLWFWLILLVCFWILMGIGGHEPAPATVETGPRMLPEAEQPAAVREVMRVEVATEHPEGARIFRGRLNQPADSAYARLRTALGADTVPLVQQDETAPAAIVLMPKRAARTALERPIRAWVHWLLFALTVATTTWAGAAHQGVNVVREPARIFAGLPYSLTLMAILGVHELGHYFAARHHGIRVTPPYFIPVPMALGTFGAFIQMRSPIEHRRALFDVAVAGPLAGLAVAIPALLVGLQTSTIVQGDVSATPMMGGASAGSSVLFALLVKLSIGPELEYGHLLRLSPLAFAGWLGLLVTALNLLPIGQLDGGHIAYAMFGHRIGTVVSTVAMWSLVLLAIFVWPGLTMWAILIFFIAGTAVPPLNDLTPLTPGRSGLGYAVFAILLLILMPLPHALWSAAGLHCPYL
jgi:membrane-associated protease RseP (regulator of RpoE activity)